jgi:hypothetical protein
MLFFFFFLKLTDLIILLFDFVRQDDVDFL